MSWLKAEASLNITVMSVTPEVSHPLMSSSKAAPPYQEANKLDMSVTPPVCHVEIWP